MRKTRDIRVTVRLSAEEWMAVSQAAGEADVYPSAWMRRAALNRLAVESGAAFTDRMGSLEREVVPAGDQRRQTRYEQWLARQPKKA